MIAYMYFFFVSKWITHWVLSKCKFIDLLMTICFSSMFLHLLSGFFQILSIGCMQLIDMTWVFYSSNTSRNEFNRNDSNFPSVIYCNKKKNSIIIMIYTHTYVSEFYYANTTRILSRDLLSILEYCDSL